MKFKMNTPHRGDIKIRTRNNILPRVVNGKLIWLEKTKVTYRFDHYIEPSQSLLMYFLDVLLGWEVYDVEFIKRSECNGDNTNE